MLPRNIIYYGKDEPLPELTRLRAGPLNMIYEQGDLRYIKFGERELLRRIYVAVRDRNWGTIPPTFSNVQMDITNDSFYIQYDVENIQDEIDFTWRGEIIGNADGTIQFIMDGISRSSFLRNRIGFCILHPASLAGENFIVDHVDGSIENGLLPVLISANQPVQPFSDMRSMACQIAPGIIAKLGFSGDIFEMEDQRNWTDASFKTFCTPLRLPYPVKILKNTRITQSVTLSLQEERKIEDR
jgi:D-apionolactonase